jgi:hypothetical protein
MRTSGLHSRKGTGRTKEDVGWDILQSGGGDAMNLVVFWIAVVVIAEAM